MEQSSFKNKGEFQNMVVFRFIAILYTNSAWLDDFMLIIC